MITLWMMIMAASPLAPSTDVLREGGMQTGGVKMTVQEGVATDYWTGEVYKTIVMKCLGPGKNPGPPKVAT